MFYAGHFHAHIHIFCPGQKEWWSTAKFCPSHLLAHPLPTGTHTLQPQTCPRQRFSDALHRASVDPSTWGHNQCWKGKGDKEQWKWVKKKSQDTVPFSWSNKSVAHPLVQKAAFKDWSLFYQPDFTPSSFSKHTTKGPVEESYTQSQAKTNSSEISARWTLLLIFLFSEMPVLSDRDGTPPPEWGRAFPPQSRVPSGYLRQPGDSDYFMQCPVQWQNKIRMNYGIKCLKNETITIVIVITIEKQLQQKKNWEKSTNHKRADGYIWSIQFKKKTKVNDIDQKRDGYTSVRSRALIYLLLKKISYLNNKKWHTKK